MKQRSTPLRNPGPSKKNHFRALFILAGLILLMSVSQRLQAANYFWVGGSGEWSDINHWVTTSGGHVNYTHVPTAFDNVFFDENSFSAVNQEVVLNAANYVCRNMNWSGATNYPTFRNQSNFGLRIFGSLKLNPNMNFNIAGEIHFESTHPNQSVDMAGHAFHNSITFNGNGGGWNLWSPLDVGTYTIYFKQGQINTQNKPIFCSSFFANYTEPRDLKLGSSQVTVSGGWNVNATNLTLDPGSSTIWMTSSSAAFINQGGFISYNNVIFTDSLGIASMYAPVQNPVSFNKVSFSNKAVIQGPYTFNQLALLNKYYELRSSDTITIIQTLVTTGNCSASVYIHATADSMLAYIRKPSGSINMNYVLLQDIAALGTAPFVAANSINLGNNPGWIIQTPSAMDLFWVDGTGKWDDPAHWSYISGGQGGACVPRPIDNVFFDSQSFINASGTVTLNGYNSFCHNIDWTGAKNVPTLSGMFPNSLNIFGSMTNINAMVFDFSGYVNFKAQDSGNAITTSGHAFLNKVVFRGYHGSWDLLDNFNAGTNLIYLEKGNVNTHSNTITCASFYSFTSHQRGLTLGSSIVNISGTHPNAWMVNNARLDFDAGTSTINFTGSYGGMLNSSGDSMSFYHVNFLHDGGCASLNSTALTASFQRVQFFNNGAISGNNIYDTLSLNNSFYRLATNHHQMIRKLMTNDGQCGVYTYIFSSDESLPAFIDKSTGLIQLNYALLQNIHTVGAASFSALNSVDLGNNNGWSINPTTPRDLYWVGGSGNWGDASHWSLSSGGVGGECVPNPSDNVFFDAASFNAGLQMVYVNSFYSFCHNLTWTNVAFQPAFAGMGASNVMISGSFTLCAGMSYTYEGNLFFTARHAGNSIHTAAHQIGSQCTFNGENGSWEFTDDFQSTKALYLIKGSLATADHDLRCKNFISINPLPRTLSLGNSTITLTSSDVTAWYVVPQNFSLNAGTSILLFVSANGGMTNSGPGTLTYHNAFFTDTSAWSELSNYQSDCRFNRVFFHSNGRIWGSNTFDTLTFFPAKTYILESGLTQTINKQLDLCGNGCFPITLKSSLPGTPSIFYKSMGTVSAAFVEMHDQHTAGGASFYAGDYSSNISGNAGWVFGSGPGYFFGLPDVDHICPGDTLNIGTYNFIGGETFEWQDGTISPYYVATHSGTYIVKVTYADNCYLTDTMLLYVNEQPFVQTSQDTSVCPGAPAILTAFGPEDASWLWNTGDTTSTILVTPAHTSMYSVTATNLCGVANHSITVSTFPMPVAIASQDTAVCPGSSITLTASGLTGSTFAWSTSDTSAQITVGPTTTGSYYVTVTDQHACGIATEEVKVLVFPAPVANAGPDTTICLGQSISLIAQGIQGSNWLWSNGAVTNTINVQPSESSSYSVTATDNHHCGVATDTVLITVTMMPAIYLSNDTSVCPGSPVSLIAFGENITDYLWSNGETSPVIQVSPTTFTSYQVLGSNACGTAIGEVTVNMHSLPQYTQHISDETCNRADGSIHLTQSYSYLWSTGATTAWIEDLTAGTYTVTLSNAWCAVTETFTVNAIQGPAAAFTANADFLYEGQHFIFRDASTNAIDWTWDFGDQLSQQGDEEVSHLYAATGKYKVTLTVSDLNGCTDTASMQVTMEYPEIFWMPNAFTPNNDGLNETFGPAWRLPELVSNYSMSIFNRWGEEIYSTKEMLTGWDGSNKQQTVADGVYTWRMLLTEAHGLQKEYTGQVVLLH